MLKHMVAALSDCWVVLTQGKKAAKQKNNYLLIHSGTPCAYSTYSCEAAVLYFLKYLSATADRPATRTVISQNLQTVVPFLLHYIAKKPAARSGTEPENSGAIGVRLGQTLMQKDELLRMLAAITQVPGLDASEELLSAELELLEKVTEMKILELNVSVVGICANAANSVLENGKMGAAGRARILGAVEEVFGKVWLQVSQPKGPQEEELFLTLYSAWKKMLVQHYAQSADFGGQFQLTFNTLVTGMSSAIPSSEPAYARLAAKLIMTLIKEVLALPAHQPFIRLAVSQYLQDLAAQIQHVAHEGTAGENVDIMVIVALNSSISLAPSYGDDISKAFSSVLELFDSPQVQTQALKTAFAIVKASATEMKNSPFAAMLLEHVLQQCYRTVEQPQGSLASLGPKLQLLLLLYQLIGLSSESMFNMVFALYLSLCGATFQNSVLKDAINSLSIVMSLNPTHFRAAVAKLDSREAKYLQLLMRLNATGQIA